MIGGYRGGMDKFCFRYCGDDRCDCQRAPSRRAWAEPEQDEVVMEQVEEEGQDKGDILRDYVAGVPDPQHDGDALSNILYTASERHLFDGSVDNDTALTIWKMVELSRREGLETMIEEIRM